MDSMRILNTSLPRPSPRRRRKPTPGELHQAFKSAALTVTQLYKSALVDVQGARAAGYQDALDDLLGFLDHDNLGLGDGEGWKVRQWATQRLSKVEGSDSDADSEDEKRARTSSPVVQTRSNQQPLARAEPRPAEPPQSQSSQPQPTAANAQQSEAVPSSAHSDMFHFSSGVPFPTIDDAEMTSAEVPTFHFPAPIRVDASPRNNRVTSGKHSTHSGKERGSSGTAIASLGHGAGSKRKQNYSDFFDISNPGGSKDGHGNGKKGRFT